MKKFAVFGNPIAHSKSPDIHQMFAKQFDIKLSYERILAPLDGFELSAKHFFAEHGLGANITLPFKEKAYEIANELTERAQICEAVNTLMQVEGNRLLGDNTDGEGILLDLRRLGYIKENVKTRILMIGAGGATRGALLPILLAGCDVVLTNRTFEKAQVLVKQFEMLGNIVALPLNETKNVNVDLIINATSASVSGEVPQVSAEIFNPQVACYDMFYQNTLTPFLQLAQSNGVTKLADGLGMLVGQAAFAFKLWHGVMPNLTPVLQKLRADIAS